MFIFSFLKNFITYVYMHEDSQNTGQFCHHDTTYYPFIATTTPFPISNSYLLDIILKEKMYLCITCIMNINK